MTLKNLLISIEKLTPILRCRIAWRLRSVICILIFSICILLGLNNCFAQQFNIVKQSSYYTPNDGVIPAVSNQDLAVLHFVYQPNGSVSSATIIRSSDIVTTASIDNYTLTSGGYIRSITFNGELALDNFYVCDASSIYSNTSDLPQFSTILPQIQAILESKGLGTVAQRQKYISGLHFSKGIIAVSPVDFRSYLQPWIIVGLVIAILIPAWYLMRRFLRG